MPDPVTGLIAGGAGLISGGLSSHAQTKAAKSAAGSQQAAAELGIAEQQRQFDALQQVLQPYVQRGTQAIAGLSPYEQVGPEALAQQRALVGLGGAGAQQSAISALEASPLFQAQLQQGENALLQNASATGGLRGGNIQGALAQFRPQLLNQLIQDQYSRLGGLTALGQTTTQNLAQLGQSSAAGQGAAGLQTGSNIVNLLGNIGQAQAGGALAKGQAQANLFGNIGGGIGSAAILSGLGVF